MVNYTPKLLKVSSSLDEESKKCAVDIMDVSILTVRSDMQMLVAASLMAEHRVTGAPVIDKNKKLLGYLSQKDCMKHMLNMKYYNSGPAGVVGDHMSKSLLTLHSDETLFYMLELFTKNNYQVYPVIDDEGLLLGVVGRTSLFLELNKINQTKWFEVV